MVCVLKHLLLMILRKLRVKIKKMRRNSIFNLIATTHQLITTTLIMAHIIPTTINTAIIAMIITTQEAITYLEVPSQLLLFLA